MSINVGLYTSDDDFKDVLKIILSLSDELRMLNDCHLDLVWDNLGSYMFLDYFSKYLEIHKTVWYKTLSSIWNQLIHNLAMFMFFLLNGCSIFHFGMETSTSSTGLGIKWFLLITFLIANSPECIGQWEATVSNEVTGRKQEMMLKESGSNHFSPGNPTLENKYLLTDYSYIIQNTGILETMQLPTI